MRRQPAYLLVAALLTGCATQTVSTTTAVHATTLNTLTADETREGFRLLFDGKSLDQWRTYRGTDAGTWEALEGTIHHGPGDGADLITKEEFTDFELRMDWKLAPGGNSGVFYRGTEEYEAIYWTAPEMQVLDDAAHPDGRNRLTSAGSAYGLYAAPAGVVHAAGEWNSIRIIVRGKHVEHWMNGVKVVEYELQGPDWTAKVAASKFHEWPHYGLAPKGHIAVQVHGNDVWYRNIRIKPLN
jgi:hypothetical protein